MLTIINTPLNCGRVRTLEVPNPPLLVIVPEQYSHEAERELAESLGDGASLIAEVLSFTRLATRVFTECGGLNLPAPDKPAKLLLMRLAFKTVAERLHVYGARSARPEMLATLLQLREELLQCKITPDALLAIPAFNGSALFSSKIRDLALICSAYDAELAHRYDDPRDRLTRLAALIGYSAVGDHGVIRFEGFADFTKQQLDVIAELMRKGSELEFVLHTEQLAATDFDDDILALPRETSRMLERIAVSYGVEVNHLTLTGATAAEPERTLYTASDAAAECELAAALITRWIEDDGTLSPSDIAVVAPNFSGRYEAVCTAVFARRRIPYYLSRRDDILQRAIMTLITQAFAILSGGWRYDQVFTYVKTGLSGAESIDELENYVLMWNIRGVRQWSEEFTMNPNGYSASEPDAELLERVESARRQVAEPLLRLRERGKSADTAAQQCAALYAFMEELQLAEKLALKSELLAMSGEEKLAAEYTQLWDVIAAALDVAYDVLGDIPMDQDEFGSLFTLLLGQYDLGTIPLALNRVRIGGTETIRETPVRRLIVLGASETAMPASEQAPSLLSADDRKLLAHAGVEIAGDFESNMHREYYLIGRVLSKPSESLTVVHRSDDRISWLAKAYLPPDAEPELYAPLTPYVRSRDFGLSLSPESVTLLYGENPVLTPTKVEAFQTCKFSYLMQYGLKLKARKTAEINAPEFGTIVHYVLENVTREVLALGGFTNVEPPTVRELAETYVNRYADERIPPNMRGGRFDYLFKRLRNEVVDLTDYIAAELKLSKFVPREFERHVEPTAIGGVTISGIIDRVDALELGDTLYLRVADYKTGATAFSLSDVYYGLGMQMLIYLFALTESGENIKPAGVHYTPARDVMLSMPRSSTDEEIEVKKRARLKGSGIILDEVSEDTVKGVATLEQLGKLARLVGDRLAEVGDALREGRTEPDAALERSSDCQYCGYVSSCGLVRRPEHARNLPKLNDKQFWAMVDSSDDQSSAESAEELG